MSEKERNDWAEGKAVYFPETHFFEITSGKTYNLSDPYQKAEWEAVENCPYICKDRNARDANGDFIMDGPKPTLKKMSVRYGVAELYVDRPGLEV